MARSDSVFVVVGGGEMAEAPDIVEQIFTYADKISDARMVVMTVATDREDEATEKYSSMFRKRSIKHVSMVHISEREDAYESSSLKKVEEADAFFFTGGNQKNVTGLMGGTPLDVLLKEKIKAGTLVAGSSAGAAMMSSSMITGGRGSAAPRVGGVHMAPGMSIIQDTVIDTHFTQRGRHGRLLTAVAHNPQLLGIGIDERTAMVVKGNDVRVIGNGTVTVMDGSNMSHSNYVYRDEDETIAMFDVCVHVLPNGYKYSLKERKPQAPARMRASA